MTLSIFPNIRDFIPPGKLGAILVTSRHADSSALVIDRSMGFIQLPGLKEPDALNLLLQQSESSELNSEDAKKIVERIGYHPLAITQAAAYIRKRKLPLCEFMDHYKHRREMILKNTPQLSQYRKTLGTASQEASLCTSSQETSLNVFTTWELSYQQLQSQTTEDSHEVRLLDLLAFFDEKDISEEIFAAYGFYKWEAEPAKLVEWLKNFMGADSRWNSALFEDALIVLKDLSLVQAFGNEVDGYWHSSLHPLIKDWIRLRIGTFAFKNNTLIAGMLLGRVLNIHWDWDKYLLLLPISDKQIILGHVVVQEENYEQHPFLQSAVTLNEQCLEDYASGQSWFARFLLDAGFYDSVVKTSQRGLVIRETILGLEHRDTLTCMSNLADAYRLQKRIEEAKELMLRIIEIRKRVLGEEHPHTLNSMSNLALIFQKEGRFAEAEKLGSKVLGARKSVLGDEHLYTLVSMGNLAQVYRKQGRWKEAMELTLQTREVMERALGVEHPNTLTCMNNLAVCFEKGNRLNEAIDLMEKVVSLKTRTIGSDHPHTLKSVAWLDRCREEQFLK